MLTPNKWLGTLFVAANPNISGEQEVLLTVLTEVNPSEDGTFPPNVIASVQDILALYPDEPALGSPFGTGNETFGLSPEFKQASAVVGDIMFQAPRRAWSQSASRFGVRNYAYLFSDPEAVSASEPALGGEEWLNKPCLSRWTVNAEPKSSTVTHSAELYNLYGTSFFVPHAPTDPSRVPLLDYWLSFATTLDPNDGKGAPSAYDSLTLRYEH